MEQRRERLACKFQDQEKFAAGYSPLYARLFGVIGAWLADPAGHRDPLVTWLLHAARERRTLDVTLLLAAGLHYDVLAGQPAAAELAEYYPTAGGGKPFAGRAFPDILRQAILARQDKLATFIQENTVQTNETGRGLCWLLPALSTGWTEVHLIDLGASAGLNLAADRRAYRLEREEDGREILSLGQGRPVQFRTRCQGNIAPLTTLESSQQPAILSRVGNDLAPFALATRQDELTLMSFIWGDQVDRLTRLKEGIGAFHQIQKTKAPVQLYPASLPDGLAIFLQDHGPGGPAGPIIIYNTWMTPYLEDKGNSLSGHIGRWAESQDRPVLWLQWEPPRDGSRPPEYGWCAWTADLYSFGEQQRWHLGWVHPHGGAAEFGEGLEQMQAYFKKKTH